MALPVDQLVIGMFALLTAAVTGGLAIYNTKVSRRITKTEEKSDSNQLLTAENNVVERLLPVLERKDEALDKIAEVLENILRVQKLNATRLDSIEAVIDHRCMAPELIKAIKRLEDEYERQQALDSIGNHEENGSSKDPLDALLAPFEQQNKDRKGVGQ